MKRNKNIKGVLESIPYISMNEEGIARISKNEFSIVALVSDINYSTMRQDSQEEIFDRYSKILNYFDDNFRIAFNILNKKINNDFIKDLEIGYCNDELDSLRRSYNKIITDSIKNGKGNIRKEIYLTIVIKAKDFDEAKKIFDKPLKEIQTEFQKIGSKITVLGLQERLSLLYDIINYDDIGNYNFDFYKNDKKSLLTSKNSIAPTYMKFENGYYMLNERYYKTLFVKTVGDTLSDDFINALVESNLDLNISMNFDSLEKSKSLELVRHKYSDAQSELINRRRKALKNKSIEPFIPEELQDNLDTAKELLEDLKANSDKLFYTTITVTVGANDKEGLNNNTKTLQRISSKYDVKLSTLLGQQEDGFGTTLALGQCNLSCGRYFTTTESSILIPFSVQELMQNNGLFYGRNQSNGNAIIYNRRNSKTYAHGFILGTTGSGKSVSMKFNILSTALNTKEEIYIIDPLREYEKVVKALNGEVIKLSADSDTCLNMFDMDSAYGAGKGLNAKSEYLLSVFNNMLGGLNISEKSILDRCITEVYREFISNDYEKKYTPTLRDFQQILAQQTEDEAKKMATALEIFAKGNLSNFANQTNVNSNKRIVCYDISDLGENLQTLGYLICFNDILNKLARNQKENVPSTLYCDEFHLLVNNQLSADFFIKAFKTFRHYHCLITCATQQLTDVINNQKIAATIANSSFLQLLNQNSSERTMLGKLLNLSDQQLSHIKSAEKGYGLMIINEEEIIPFENIIPKNNPIFELIRTDLKEEA